MRTNDLLPRSYIKNKLDMEALICNPRTGSALTGKTLWLTAQKSTLICEPYFRMKNLKSTNMVDSTEED